MRKLLAVFAVCLGFASSIGAADARSHASTHCLPGDLKNTLNQLESRFGQMKVISTHRPGARVRGSGRRSLHADCRAVDFRPSKGQHAAVVSWLRQNHSGGLGTYSGRHNHIHIDNGGAYSWHNGSRGRTRMARGRGGSRVASARRGGRGVAVAGYRSRGRVASSRRGRSRTVAARRGGRNVAVAAYRSRGRAASRRASSRMASSGGRTYASRSYRNRAERRQARRGEPRGIVQRAFKLPGFQG